MPNTDISGLLKRVSPALVAGYEKKNIPNGRTLRQVMVEQDSLGKNIERILVPYIAVLALIAVGVVSVLHNTLSGHVIFWALLSIMVFAFASSSFVFMKKALGYEHISRRNKEMLDDFRFAVERLNPTEMMDGEFTETSVRDILVSLAIHLLDSETKFKNARINEKVSTRDLLIFGQWEEGNRGHFNEALQAVGEFGLTFNKADLFRDAKKHLERTQ